MGPHCGRVAVGAAGTTHQWDYIMKKQLLILSASCAALILSAPAQADALSYALTGINGSWSWGNTQWNAVSNLGYVDNVADIGTVDALLSGPYAYSAPGDTPANAIYNWAGSPYGSGAQTLVFSVNGGVSALLDSLTILSSRSYDTGTLITLDYSNDGGASWINAVSSTTGALGWDNVDITGGGTDSIALDFGGVTGNAFRFGVSGAQINLHTLALDGTMAAVPEPATWAMMIGGFALAGAAMRRRRTAIRFA